MPLDIYFLHNLFCFLQITQDAIGDTPQAVLLLQKRLGVFVWSFTVCQNFSYSLRALLRDISIHIQGSSN